MARCPRAGLSFLRAVLRRFSKDRTAYPRVVLSCHASAEGPTARRDGAAQEQQRLRARHADIKRLSISDRITRIKSPKDDYRPLKPFKFSDGIYRD